MKAIINRAKAIKVEKMKPLRPRGLLSNMKLLGVSIV
jgi:hypothetical protein